MGAGSVNVKLLESRANMYRFLSRLYILEVDEALLRALQAMKFPENGGDDILSEGYALMKSCLAEMGPESLDDLDVDYARIFLAAGVAQGVAAFPYESVYTSKKRLVVQEARNQAVAAYVADGLAVNDAMSKVPEDHVAIELEYMANLCSEAVLAKQKSFFEQHIKNWVTALAKDVERYAATDFYRALGKITAGFISLEQAWFGQ